MTTHQHAPLPVAHKGGWAEYRRLVKAGVNEAAARTLARLRHTDGDERAYWRQLSHGRRPTNAARAAHARAQAERRASARTGRVA